MIGSRAHVTDLASSRAFMNLTAGARQLTGITGVSNSDSFTTAGVSTGDTPMATTLELIMFLRVNAVCTATRAFAGAGEGPAPQGGWEWRHGTAIGNGVIQLRLRDGTGTARNVDTGTDWAGDGLDHILFGENASGTANLYADGSATVLDTSVCSGATDDGTSPTEFGEADGNSLAPASALTLYGWAYGTGLVTADAGFGDTAAERLANYYAACKVAGQLVPWSGCANLWNVGAASGALLDTLYDEVGSLNLPLVGTPTLVQQAPNWAA